MNNALQLKGQFQYSKGKQPGPISLPAGKVITATDIQSLAASLETAAQYWRSMNAPCDPLVSVYYKGVMAKSNRVKRLLYGSKEPDAAIVGARFDEDARNPSHIITYCIDFGTIEATQLLLAQCEQIVATDFGGIFDNDKLQTVNANGLKRGHGNIAKSHFAQAMHDICFVDHFGVLLGDEEIAEESVVTLFRSEKETTSQLLCRLGITIDAGSILGDAVRMCPEQYAELVERYPYLIAMTCDDMSQYDGTYFGLCSPEPEVASIPDPGGEPVIGVIDTPFDNRVYFADWVEEHVELDEAIEIHDEDKRHGTEVTSIIVDGPSIEPRLDDGCGRFRVRHFGVATGGRFSSFEVMRSIQRIVRENRDIKVWNISLGSMKAVSPNFISPEGAILDALQTEYKDIVFVVSGTNRQGVNGPSVIGAPADSINSIVVNATAFDGSTPDYSRSGPVLRFFRKPDVCAVGGSSKQPVHLCNAQGETWGIGTSFSAPWIARKMAYLMQVMGLTREVAKALLIDSAAGWNQQGDACRGYGVVPTRIEDILKTKNDEIKFVLTGSTEALETYNYNIPVPTLNGTHPYVARATLCYFPECSRRQGVDYTSTEMDLHFGRLKDGKIQALNKNKQGDEGSYLYEEQARSQYRKWDNVKHVGEVLKDSSRARKAYDTALWGIKIRTTERGRKTGDRSMPFGAVVTLKAIDGVNRYSDFVQRCWTRGWIVTEIDMDTRVEVYDAAEVDIDFED